MEVNRVQNTLMITEEPNRLFHVQCRLMSEQALLDFNRLVPTPQRLRGIVVGRLNWNGQILEEWIEINNEPQPLSSEFKRNLKEQYGASNWRDWRLKNWGCIFPAENTTLYKPSRDRLIYRFETDRVPEQLITKFNEDFGNFQFSWMVSDNNSQNFEEALTTYAS